MSKTRPEIKAVLTENTLEIEKFQNQTIRPIIKMQHHFLIGLFEQLLNKNKIDFSGLAKVTLYEKTKAIFEKNTNFKHLILGVIIGHFSTNEFEIYSKYTNEFHKRIIQITIQRIQDSYLK